MKPTAAVLLAVLAAAPGLGSLAWAQEAAAPAPKCPEDAKPLPPDLAGWTARQPLAAAADPAKLASAVLPAGRAVDAAMLPASEVNFAARPGKSGGPESRGGLFRIVADHAGTYRVAISTGLWIDAIVDGKALEPVAHAHGPACSGIRKVVDYALPAGEHILQLSAGEGETTTILVVERR